MKWYNYILLVLFLWSCSKDDNSATPPTVNTVTGTVSLVRSLGGSNNESAQSVLATQDGGYVVLGYTHSNDGDITGETDTSFDIWLLKFNAANVLEWQKTYGGTDEDRGFDIVQTSDGGFAILGYSKSSDEDVTENAGGRDYWVLKVDANGTIIWQKSHGFIGSDYGTSLTTTQDNGLLLMGVIDVTSSGGDGNDRISNRHAGGDYWAVKLDAGGNKVWRHYYGGNLADTPNDVIETPEGGFIIVGGADSTDVDITNNKGSYDYWVVKISATGTLLWQKNFGGSEIDRAYGIAKATDGGYLIIGDTNSTDQDVSSPKGASDIWLIKIDANGNLLWQKSIGGTAFDTSRAIISAEEGGFFLVGSSRSIDGDFQADQGQNDAMIVKVSDTGNVEWQQTIGGSEIDFFYDVTQLTNEKVVAVGDTMSSNGDLTTNNGFTDILITVVE